MRFPAIISIVIISINLSAFAQNRITYTENRGTYKINNNALDTLHIEYEFDFSSFSQTHWSIDYIFQTGNFPKFLDLSFGTQMHYLHKEYLIDLVDDIYDFSKQYDLDAFQTLSIVIAFVNSLSNVNSSDYSHSSFYNPYEIIFTGVHKEMDRQSLFAGVMSMLCYDFSVVFRDKQMIVSVLVEGEEDFYYQDMKYKALLPHYDPQFEKIYNFDKICHFQKKYMEAMSPHFIHQLREHQHMGTSQYAFSNIRSGDQNYSANVAMTSGYRSESTKLLIDDARIQNNKQIKGYVIKDDGQRLNIVSEIR